MHVQCQFNAIHDRLHGKNGSADTATKAYRSDALLVNATVPCLVHQHVHTVHHSNTDTVSSLTVNLVRTIQANKQQVALRVIELKFCNPAFVSICRSSTIMAFPLSCDICAHIDDACFFVAQQDHQDLK